MPRWMRFVPEVIVAGAVCAVGLWVPVTDASTWGYLAGAGALALVVLLPPGSGGKRRLSALVSGAAIVIATATARIGAADDGPTMRARTFVSDARPTGSMMALDRETEVTPARLVGRAFSERDLAVAGARVLVESGGLPASDSEGFLPALEAAYDRMEAAEGVVPTPIGATYAFAQTADRFDALVVEAPAGSSPHKAVIFLHGFAGNYSVQCWHMAQAARVAGALTVCPSVGWRGAWWEPAGARTLEATFHYLRARGITTVVLAGLSNGARGVSLLAARYPRHLDGIIVLSGAAPRAPPRGVPVLAVQGTRDTMFAPAAARRYAQRAGRRGRYVPIDTGHFMFLDRVDEVRAPLVDFLERVRTTRFGTSRFGLRA